MFTNQRQKRALLALPVAAACVLYLGGVLSQFIRNTQLWKAAGGIPGIGTGPAWPSFSYLAALRSCFSDLYGLAGLAICLAGLAAFLFGVLHIDLKKGGRIDRERNLTYSGKGVHGTAGMMDGKAAARVLHLEKDAKHTCETILGELDGKLVTFPLDSELNRNIAVCGSPGSRKSRSFTRNMVLQCVRRGESLIITDTKGEIYRDFAKYLEQNGYEVRVFHTGRPQCSDSWDLIGEVGEDPNLAEMVSNVIIQNTGIGGDSFWAGNEQNLLKGALLYMGTRRIEDRTMRKLYENILNSTGEFRDIMLSVPLSNPARLPFRTFLAQDDSNQGKIINGLASRLQIFQSEDICGMTSYPEIDLKLPGVKKCAYFCISSDQHHAFDFLTSLFVTFSFIRLTELADEQENLTLPVHVHILGEELANFAAIPNLGQRLSTVRSRGVSMSCVFQSIPQLQNRYPDNEWLEIVSDSDVQLYLGVNDPITAKFVSDRSGVTSVEMESHSKQLNSWRVSDYTPQYRQTESVGRRMILNPDEVLRMPRDEALLIVQGQNIMKVKKFDFSRHPDAGLLAPANAAAHVPAWKLQARPEPRREIAKSTDIPDEPDALNGFQEPDPGEEPSGQTVLLLQQHQNSKRRRK